MKEIRKLRANEIDCRVKSVTAEGCILLLYKDARVDMALLDETYGSNNWQRTHEVINGNLFCNIDIWDVEKKVWVRKQDVGIESNTEKEKGQASDAFKRAGFNVGIGRELYTAPFIWINLSNAEIINKNGKFQLASGIKFEVKDIGYADDRISNLVIVDGKGEVRYSMKGGLAAPKRTEPKEMPKASDDQLDLAIQEAKEAKTAKEMELVWKRWKGYQGVLAFKEVVAQRGAELRK